ncbi:hypothetical protein J6T66_06305 [bacterium]|nr:hypothetical protein [bacterium]
MPDENQHLWQQIKNEKILLCGEIKYYEKYSPIIFRWGLYDECHFLKRKKIEKWSWYDEMRNYEFLEILVVVYDEYMNLMKFDENQYLYEKN